jgi:hypothetical protein
LEPLVPSPLSRPSPQALSKLAMPTADKKAAKRQDVSVKSFSIIFVYLIFNM